MLPPMPGIPVVTSRSSQSPRDQAIDSGRGVVKLLIFGVMVAVLHLRHQPAVVAHLLHGSMNRRPVVVSQKQIRIDALFAAAPPMLLYILQVDSGDIGP